MLCIICLLTAHTSHHCVQMERMERSLESVTSNFASIRTGRATPTMLDRVKVHPWHLLCNCWIHKLLEEQSIVAVLCSHKWLDMSAVKQPWLTLSTIPFTWPGLLLMRCLQCVLLPPSWAKPVVLQLTAFCMTALHLTWSSIYTLVDYRQEGQAACCQSQSNLPASLCAHPRSPMLGDHVGWLLWCADAFEDAGRHICSRVNHAGCAALWQVCHASHWESYNAVRHWCDTKQWWQPDSNQYPSPHSGKPVVWMPSIYHPAYWSVTFTCLSSP